MLEGIKVGWIPGQLNTGVFCWRLGDVMVDTGSPLAKRPVLEFARRHKIARAFPTHGHEDHCGLAHALSEGLNVDVAAPEMTGELMSRGFPVQVYRAMVWGRPEKTFRPRVMAESEPLASGMTLRKVATPGHSPDHHVFHVPEAGLLFAGDLFVSRKITMTNAHQDPLEEMESLRAVLRLPDWEVLLCGHRGIVEDGRAAVADKLRAFELIEAAVRECEDRGLSLAQITKKVLGRESVQYYFSLGHFSRERLVAGLSKGFRGHHSKEQLLLDGTTERARTRHIFWK